ncbi:MAG: hypothetical protein K6F99_08740, partial [Lachnospiraceae bacterium]|nr:hypothetical protein [Lachnospiraceae bacterium]
YDHKPFTEHVISGEWLPLTVKDIHALTDDCDVAYTGDKTIKVSRYKNELEVGLTGNEEYVDVPFVYYKGYAAVSTADGKVLICDGEGDNGRVRVYPDGAKNIRVYYKGTIIGIVSTLVSLGTLILCIVLLIMKKRKKK